MSKPVMPIPSSGRTVMGRLRDAGYHVYIVGGSVRDCLRGEVPHDYDMTTDATPEEMLRVFSGMRVIETGLKHGTLTVLSDGLPYEVTTYRVDGTYADHRHPDEVTFTRDLTGDLARRDFTMNAIAYHPEEGYIDPFGGIADIEAKKIRAVGEARLRFEEDALRILRAIRFSAVLGFEIEEETKRAIFSCCDLLGHISAERVRDELMKLLTGKDAAKVLREYRTVIAICIPELTSLFDCPQHTPYHAYDVWEHTVRVVEALPHTDPFLRLAGLLHDIAKPQCRKTDAMGIDHFKGHAPLGAKAADNILARLRFDNKSREKMYALILRHDDRTPPRRADVLRLLSEIGYENFLLLCDLSEADIAAHHPTAPSTQAGLSRNRQVRELGRALEENHACYRISDLALDGKEIMAQTSLRGRQVGEALRTLLEAVMDGKVENTREGLLTYLAQCGTSD